MERRRLELAEEALGVGDAEGALRILDAHLAQWPDDADARALRDAALAIAADATGALTRFGDLRADARHMEAAFEARVAARAAPPWGVMFLAALNVAVAFVAGVLGAIALARHPGLGLLALMAAGGIFGMALGLWRLRGWAWLATLVLSGTGVFVSTARIAGGNWSGAAGLLLQGAVVVYLIRVRRAFRG